jgi:hypothetical protein
LAALAFFWRPGDLSISRARVRSVGAFALSSPALSTFLIFLIFLFSSLLSEQGASLAASARG